MEVKLDDVIEIQEIYIKKNGSLINNIPSDWKGRILLIRCESKAKNITLG